MIKVGIYARVSTDIQVREGDSIPAQLSALRQYAKKHGYEIVGEFVDDGISGRLLDERDELQNLLDYVKRGRIDKIIFTRLDRWFRNVKHYLNTQEVLDDHNVTWTAIWESYTTENANGRLMINQMLSFAQFESENTSVRINHVFDYKKTKREVLSGKVPFGYRIVDKHYAIDPEKGEIAKKVFDTYIETGNMCGTIRLFQGYGLPRSQRGFKMMLQNRKYIGEAHGDSEYIPPLIDKQKFETVQRMLQMNIKSNQVNNYIFTGLIWCSDCGRKISGTSDAYKERRYKTYRCMYKYRPVPDCINSKTLNEKKLEEYLVENLKDLAFSDITEKDRKKAVDYEVQIAVTEKKISRLKELYVNELINLDEYKHDLAEYRAQIEDFKQLMNKYEGGDKTSLKALIGSNLADWYWTLTDDEKRKLWRSVIKKIWFGSDRKLRIEFL